MLGASSACVIGEPDFTPPARTRPVLVPLSPPNTELIKKPKLDPNGFAAQTFQVLLYSEDAQDDLDVVLFLDYGIPTPEGQPYQEARKRKAEAGSGGPRPISRDWTPTLENGETHACTSVTLMVTHELFNNSPLAECPADVDDSASVTWFVAYCENLGDCTFDDCAANEPEGGYSYCPPRPSVDDLP
jgi:hypothetical protein